MKTKKFVVILTLALLSLGLRIADFPHWSEVRDMDEIGYLQGGLQLLEGQPPGYKAAPGGPQFWMEWAYAAVHAAKDFFTGGEERQVPLAVRPYVAVNQSLFDAYRDLSAEHYFIIIIFTIFSVLAVIAATTVGYHHAGTAGGILLGGLFGVLPLFMNYAVMSRPYALAWDFAIFSIAAAAWRNRKAVALSAVMLGLAIACRIEMLCIVPLVWWQFWEQRPVRPLVRVLMRVTLVAAVTALLFSPWLMTSFLGELRAIATVRFATPPMGHTPWTTALRMFCWQEGMLFPILIALAGLVFVARGRRICAAALAIYTLFLLASLMQNMGFGIHQHGAVFIALALLATVSIAPIHRQFPRTAVALAALALILPLTQSILSIRSNRRAYVDDHVTEWVEAHVPDGTRLYLGTMELRSPLPTAKASDALWTEVTDNHAWVAKFQSGLSRFKLRSDVLPRALADENLVQERGNRRMWFILGSRPAFNAPRYDIRLIDGSPVFGIHDLQRAWMEDPGVVVWNDIMFGPAPSFLGKPAVSWDNKNHMGVHIFLPAGKTLANP